MALLLQFRGRAGWDFGGAEQNSKKAIFGKRGLTFLAITLRDPIRFAKSWDRWKADLTTVTMMCPCKGWAQIEYPLIFIKKKIM